MSSSSANSSDMIPTDPSDPYFFKNCYVCKAVAKPDQEFIRNYGGIVCFSCRAFWRRIHLKSKHPSELRCKYGGGCSMVVTSQRKCPRCRYDLCVKAGMNPKAILTEEQKKVRFRKMLKRKHDEQLAMDQSEASSSQESINATNGEIGDEVHELIQAPAVPFPTNCEDLFLGNSENSRPSKTHRIMSRKCQEIITSYEEIMTHFGTSAFQDLDNLFRVISAEGSAWILTPKLVNPIIFKMNEELMVFAKKQRIFASLSENDQSQLLRRNTPLYVQLQLGACLVGQDQDSMAMPLCESDDDEMTRFDLKLQALNNLMKPGSNNAPYLKLLRRLRNVCLLREISQRALLSYFLLFEIDVMQNVDDRSAIEDVMIMNTMLFKNQITRVDQTFDFQSFMLTLVRMSAFCSENINFEVEMDLAVMSSLKMVYTETEDLWFRKQCQLVREAYLSVPMGEDLLNEYFMHSLGVPLSKHYFPQYFSILKERMKRVYKTSTVFDNLASDLQDIILRVNSNMGIAIIATRAENYKSGFEQLMNACSNVDNAWWKRKFSSVFDNKEKIKPLSVKDGRILTSGQVSNYVSITTSSKILVEFPDLFKMFLLIALTLPDESLPATAAISASHRIFIQALGRRLDHMEASNNFGPKYSHYKASEILSMMMFSIQSLRQMEVYLKVINDANFQKPSSMGSRVYSS